MASILEDAAHQCLLSDDHPALFDALPSFEGDLDDGCPAPDIPSVSPPVQLDDNGASGSSLPATPAERPCTFCPLSLPLPAPSCPTRATLVLDLDGTLIASEELNAINSTYLRDTCTSRSPDYEAIGRRVWLRPGVREFLTAVRPHFEIVLFTAATQNWAAAAIEQLDPSAYLFDVMLHRDHTTSDLMWDYVKDLSRLGRDLSRVVIVDDNPLMFMYQPDNALHVQAYEAAAAGGPDNVLERVAELLIGQVAPASDVREVLGPMASAKACILSTIAVAAAAAVGAPGTPPQGDSVATEDAAATAAGAAGGAAPMDVAPDVPGLTSGTQRHGCGRPGALAPCEAGSGWSAQAYASDMCMAGVDGDECGALFGFAGADGALEIEEGDEGQDEGLLQADGDEQVGGDGGSSIAAGAGGGRCGAADEPLSDGGDEEDGEGCGGGSESEAEVEVFDEHGAAARLGGGRCWGRRGRGAGASGAPAVDAMDADAAGPEGADAASAEEGDGTCSGPDSDDFDALMDETISISGYDSDIAGGLDDEGEEGGEETEEEAGAEAEEAVAAPCAGGGCAADAGCLCGCGPGACGYRAAGRDAAGPGAAAQCGGERVFAPAAADGGCGPDLDAADVAAPLAQPQRFGGAAGLPEARAAATAAAGASAACCAAVVEGLTAACELAGPAPQQQPQPGLPGMVFLTDLHPALALPQPPTHPGPGVSPGSGPAVEAADAAHAEGAPPCKRARVDMDAEGAAPASGCGSRRAARLCVLEGAGLGVPGACAEGGPGPARLAGLAALGNSGGAVGAEDPDGC